MREAPVFAYNLPGKSRDCLNGVGPRLVQFRFEVTGDIQESCVGSLCSVNYGDLPAAVSHLVNHLGVLQGDRETSKAQLANNTGNVDIVGEMDLALTRGDWQDQLWGSLDALPLPSSKRDILHSASGTTLQALFPREFSQSTKDNATSSISGHSHTAHTQTQASLTRNKHFDAFTRLQTVISGSLTSGITTDYHVDPAESRPFYLQVSLSLRFKGLFLYLLASEHFTTILTSTLF